MTIQEIVGSILRLVNGITFATCWDDVINWLSDLLLKVREEFANIAYAAAIFVQKVRDAYVEIAHKLYYREEEGWVEKTTAMKIKESEVPMWISSKISEQECDMSTEFEQNLDLTLY